MRRFDRKDLNGNGKGREAYSTNKLGILLLTLLLLLLVTLEPNSDCLGSAETIGIAGATHSEGIHEASLSASLTRAHKHVSTGTIYEGLLHIHCHHLIIGLTLRLLRVLTRHAFRSWV
jgi:hypothetical protein